MKTEDRLKEREVTVEYLEKAFDHYNPYALADCCRGQG